MKDKTISEILDELKESVSELVSYEEVESDPLTEFLDSTKDKTVSEMLDELKETIIQHSEALWEWEGCEGYCDLLNDLVPMVDEIKKKSDSTNVRLTPESKKRQEEQTTFFNKFYSDNVEVARTPNYDEIFEWLSMIPEGTIISRNGGVGMGAVH